VNLFLEMLENKVEELKTSPLTPLLRGEGDSPKMTRINTSIDLNI
jgi:hypothetical protein